MLYYLYVFTLQNENVCRESTSERLVLVKDAGEGHYMGVLHSAKIQQRSNELSNGVVSSIYT